MPSTSKSSLRVAVVDESMKGSCAYIVCFRAMLMNGLLHLVHLRLFTILFKNLEEIRYSAVTA